MSSVVDICNLALSNIRGGSINSLNEPNTQAQQCKLKYPAARDSMQRNAPWNFCHKIVPLGELQFVDVFGWTYSYQYPADCLLINRVILNQQLASATQEGFTTRHNEDVYQPDLTRQVKYEVVNVNGNKVIVSNDAQLRIDYRARVEDSSIFDSEFTLALSWLLAAELAIPIVGGEEGRALRKDALNVYGIHLENAEINNSNENYDYPRESEFIDVRK